jgi:hypothetical protein
MLAVNMIKAMPLQPSIVDRRHAKNIPLMLASAPTHLRVRPPGQQRGERVLRKVRGTRKCKYKRIRRREREA